MRNPRHRGLEGLSWLPAGQQRQATLDQTMQWKGRPAVHTSPALFPGSRRRVGTPPSPGPPLPAPPAPLGCPAPLRAGLTSVRPLTLLQDSRLLGQCKRGPAQASLTTSPPPARLWGAAHRAHAQAQGPAHCSTLTGLSGAGFSAESISSTLSSKQPHCPAECSPWGVVLHQPIVRSPGHEGLVPEDLPRWDRATYRTAHGQREWLRLGHLHFF